MRSFSVRPARLILVPSAPSHTPLCLSVPHHPRQSSSHTPFSFPSHIIPVSPPVTRPCTFPSHIILVNPSSHTPFYLSVSRHPRQPPSHIPFYLSVPHHPRQPSSHMPFYLFISFNISSHLCVFSPLVLDPWGKCREFLRKRFTFPRGSQGHRLHRPLSRHLPFPPPGKVPGISAKTVHFPPWPTRVPAPQASLAALAVSPSGESAGNFRKNGSLSPAADKGTGSTGLSGRTCSLSLRGKCREFRRKRFTFPRGRPGHWLHRPLWPHLAFPPPGKVPSIQAL